MEHDLSAKEFALDRWINEHLDGLAVSNEPRILMSTLCHDVAIEHHLAIAKLLDNRINGTAFALVRLVFDAYVRGLWLRWCASDAQIREYENDNLNIGFSKMVDAVEQMEEFEERALSGLRRRSWRAMNSYAHTGILQLGRRVMGNDIRPNYTQAEIKEIMGLSGLFALLAFQQIATAAGRPDLARKALENMESDDF